MQPAVSLGLDLLSRRNADLAGQLRESLASMPGSVPVLCELAIALSEHRQADAAAGVFMEALKSDMGCAAAHKGLGLLLEEGCYFADAAECYASALHLQPTSENHYLLGRALQQVGELDRSEQHYRAALQLDPDNVDAYYNLGVLWASRGRSHDAIGAFREVTSRAPAVSRAWTSLGALLSEDGRGEEAIACLEEALRIEPENVLARANLADALRTCDRTEEARRQADQALELDAAHPLAGSVRARIDLQEGCIEEARDRLLRLLNGDPPPQLRGRILVDLGMAHDRLREHDLAFAASCEGQALLASQQPAASFDSAAYPALLRCLARWTPTALDAVRGSTPTEAETVARQEPVFLIGFPRSGTTLTEQILCCHPQLQSLDERPLLDRLTAAASALAGGTAYPECLDSLDEAQVDKLREQYWQMVEGEGGEDHSARIRVIDKMPLNLVHMGFINRLFPTAPLLVALRDPRDCCISAFMQDFAPNEAMIQFSDLERTTALYAQVMSLWLGWRGSLRNPWLETRYEDLVEDLEGAARRMLDFLGLPWDPEVLDYHVHAARKHISTPSHKDVTKPIFRRALRRWERYQNHFEPYLPRLHPFVDAFGYEP